MEKLKKKDKLILALVIIINFPMILYTLGAILASLGFNFIQSFMFDFVLITGDPMSLSPGLLIFLVFIPIGLIFSLVLFILSYINYGILSFMLSISPFLLVLVLILIEKLFSF